MYPQGLITPFGDRKALRRPVRSSLYTLAWLLCAFVGAGQAGAATKTAKVSANVVKPLTIKWVQDLSLGSVTLAPGTWSNAQVSISRSGVFSCASTNLVCTGIPGVATYNVVGSNGQTVRISAPNVTLVNQGDSTKTLTLAVDSPGTVVIPNSGNKGANFSLGGTITLNSTTAAGTYQGTFNVTVDY
jgi:hypothetical protein